MANVLIDFSSQRDDDNLLKLDYVQNTFDECVITLEDNFDVVELQLSKHHLEVLKKFLSDKAIEKL